jgi:hypothetical protein
VSSRLFAFQLAKPVELSDEVSAPLYDPQTQTMVWHGQSDAELCLRCTRTGSRKCNAYGNYCSTWGSGSYRCDSR